MKTVDKDNIYVQTQRAVSFKAQKREGVAGLGVPSTVKRQPCGKVPWLVRLNSVPGKLVRESTEKIRPWEQE